jgi:hypothetical protein
LNGTQNGAVNNQSIKNNQVQLHVPVIFSTNKENQNPWHMHIFNIHTKIQQNKRLFTQKLWEELAGQMIYPIWNMYPPSSNMTNSTTYKFSQTLMTIKILGTCISSIYVLIVSKIRGSSLKNCGRN